MLTEKHLAVVRAALRYMDEEMSPSGSKAMYHYFDQRGKVCQPTIGDVTDARKLFECGRTELRTGRCFWTCD